MEKINQEQTRNKIKNLRLEKGYSQTKLAKLMGVSRTYYNGIENGTNKVTELYLKTLADFYGVDICDIAVFTQTFDEGFYRGLKVKQKLQEKDFDSMSMKIYQLGKEIETGKKYTSTLYPALKAMGYKLEVVDIRDCNEKTIPKDMLDSVQDNKIFVLKKGNKKIGYWSPTNYYEFERFITSAIKGYINDIADESEKAMKNQEEIIAFSNDGRFVYRKKLPFKKAKAKDNSFVLKSGEEMHSIRRQVREMQTVLQEYSEQLTDIDAEGSDADNENG